MLFVIKYWRLIAVAAFLAVWMAAIGVQSIRLDHAKAEAQQARRELAVANAAIVRQNAAVDAMKADSDRRDKMLADALEQARKAASVASGRAVRLETMRPKGSTVCAQLLDVDRAVLEGMK